MSAPPTLEPESSALMVVPPPPVLTVDDFLEALSAENTSAGEILFEGPEKLLEIWFEPSPAYLPRRGFEHNIGTENYHRIGLRTIKREVWDDILKIVKCKILSFMQNKNLDAYLLSESSMFVYPHKLILKTCGTTTLLIALPHLLKIAADYCHFDKVWRVFYSRKSFLFPERQSHPHKDWKDEVAFLDHLFDNGAAYTVGKINGDHWNLYLTSPQDDVLIGHTSSTPHHIPEPPIIDNHPPSKYLNTSEDEGYSSIIEFQDQTIEILMTHLEPAAAEKFYNNKSDDVQLDRTSSLGSLYPDAQLDSYLFQPCGYSANGLLNDGYFTVHVTPEPVCSYASFETNIPLTHGTISDLIQQVISIFQPGKFSVTVFTSCEEKQDKRHLVAALGSITGFDRKDRILYEFDGYDLVFGHYEKKKKLVVN